MGAKAAGGSANSMLRHLIGAGGAIRAELGQRIAALGHAYAPAASHVVMNLPPEGLGVSELAERLRLTPQRTGQLIQNLEENGYVTREPDPEDRRAKRVVFTKRGLQLVEDMARIDAEATRDFAERLGPRRFERLCRDLEALDQSVREDDDWIDLRPR